MDQLTFYTPSGNYVLHINGGHMTIRKQEQKPYEAVEVSSPGAKIRIHAAIYSICDVVQELQRDK